jgi:hypothetical protein
MWCEIISSGYSKRPWPRKGQCIPTLKVSDSTTNLLGPWENALEALKRIPNMKRLGIVDKRTELEICDCCWFIGLAYQGKDIVFRFIGECSSTRDFVPWVKIGLFLYEDFWKMIFWLVLKLEISYRVIISWRILGFFWEDVFSTLDFCIFEFP